MLLLLPLDSLLKKLTADDVKRNLYALLDAFKLPTTAWGSGAVVRTIISVLSVMLGGLGEVAYVIAASGFLDTAEKRWLTRLAKLVYNVDRIPAIYAPGFVTLTNTAGGVYVLDAGDVVLRNPTTKKTYYTTAAVTLDSVGAPGAVQVVPVLAFEAGSGSTSTPTTVTELVTTLLGVTVTNAAPIIGQDEETDDALRSRCLDKLGALSPDGPEAAYLYVAKSATRADGTAIGVTRVKVPTPPGDGTLQVIVATESGALSGTAGDLTTDLGRVADQVIKKATPLTAVPMISSALEVEVTPTCTVYVPISANVSDGEIRAAIAAKLTAFFKTIPIGGVTIPPASVGALLWRSLLGQIESASPYIIEAKLAAEADIALAYNAVAVLVLNPSVDITVQRVAA